MMISQLPLTKTEQAKKLPSGDILKSFMLGVVKRGTGKKADVEGILVGGKTGTAQKFNEKTKKYKKYGHLASFIGYAPHENPKYVLGIFLDEPTPNHYGGQVAAPIFSSIIKRIMEYIPEAMKHIHDYTEEAMDINATLRDKMTGLTPEQFEGMLRPAFEADEWQLVALGAVLGGLVGWAQLVYVFGMSL